MYDIYRNITLTLTLTPNGMFQLQRVPSLTQALSLFRRHSYQDHRHQPKDYILPRPGHTGTFH